MNTTITLTDSQQFALDRLKEFIKSDNQHFRLTGYAGTGKSFTIAQFMKWLQEQKISFVAGSPTNKAAKNLAKIAQENGIACDVTTVAKLLGQQPELNQDTGKEEFITGESSIGNYDVVLFDEAYMINRQNIEDIMTEIYGKKTKAIYIGDNAQLPPVGESQSILDIHPYIKDSTNLTEVVRYDGDIAHVSEQIRMHSFFNKHVYPFVTTDDGTIICLPRDEWLEKAAELFSDGFFAFDGNNPSYVRFLTWRNRTADSLNNFVRAKFWGDECDAYVPGDRLIAKSPVFRLNAEGSSHKGKDVWTIIISSSEEVEVIGRATKGKDKTYQWEYWEVPIEADDGLRTSLRILTKESIPAYKECLDNCAKVRKWKQYHYFKKLYDDMAFAYAITTHKAQGSSIDYCFIDVPDMRACPDLQKILYTALTRAKQTAFILQ